MYRLTETDNRAHAHPPPFIYLFELSMLRSHVHLYVKQNAHILSYSAIKHKTMILANKYMMPDMMYDYLFKMSDAWCLPIYQIMQVA